MGKTLCPQLGAKGTIKDDEMKVDSKENEFHILGLQQFLGGIMQKAQEIYWSEYRSRIANHYHR